MNENGPVIDPYRHPKMSRENRAKQFAPFAALSGLAAALLAKEFEVSEAAETVRTEAEDAPP